MIRGFFFLIALCMTSLGNAQESTASKNVSTFTIEAPQLKTTKKIWIYLPENYSKNIQKKIYSNVYARCPKFI